MYISPTLKLHCFDAATPRDQSARQLPPRSSSTAESHVPDSAGPNPFFDPNSSFSPGPARPAEQQQQYQQRRRLCPAGRWRRRIGDKAAFQQKRHASRRGCDDLDRRFIGGRLCRRGHLFDQIQMAGQPIGDGATASVEASVAMRLRRRFHTKDKDGLMTALSCASPSATGPRLPAICLATILSHGNYRTA